MSANTSKAPKKGGVNKEQNDKKQTTTTTSTPNNNSRFNKDNKDNKDNKNNNNNKQYPEDPVIVSFDKRIGDIISLLKEQTAQTLKLRDEQKELGEKKKKIKDDIEALSSENKAIIPLFAKNKEQRILIDKLIKEHEIKKAHLKDIEKSLPVKVNSSSTQITMKEEIENKVQHMEKKIENERDLQTQRQLLRELKDINSQKHSIEEYFAQKELIQAHDLKIRQEKQVRKEINDQIDKLLGPDRKKDNKSTKEEGTTTTTESAIKPKDASTTTTATTTTTPDASNTTTTTDGKQEKKKRDVDPNSPLGKLFAARNACSERSKEIYQLLKFDNQTKRDDLEAKLQDERVKKQEYIKERNEKRKVEKKLKEEERKKQKEEYEAKKELEREQKRLLEVPYQDEIITCEDLLRYLISITPKETKTVDVSSEPTQTAVDGYTLLVKKEKRSAKKPAQAKQTQQQPDIIRHSIDTIGGFEKISVVLPTKIADVAEAKTQVQAKLDHFKKLSTKAIEEREQKIAEKKLAESKESTTTTSEVPKVEVEAQ